MSNNTRIARSLLKLARRLVAGAKKDAREMGFDIYSEIVGDVKDNFVYDDGDAEYTVFFPAAGGNESLKVVLKNPDADLDAMAQAIKDGSSQGSGLFNAFKAQVAKSYGDFLSENSSRIDDLRDAIATEEAEYDDDRLDRLVSEYICDQTGNIFLSAPGKICFYKSEYDADPVKAVDDAFDFHGWTMRTLLPGLFL